MRQFYSSAALVIVLALGIAPGANAEPSGNLTVSVIGVRSVIQTGATIRNSIVMGADYYETDPESIPAGLPPIGIGRNCVIDRAIIDKNARIADGVVITPEGKPADYDGDNYFIRDGIVVVPKNAVIPAGVWI